MEYNKSNIKPFKGRLVELQYYPRLAKDSCVNKLVGLIIANTNNNIIFKLKSNPEIVLKYSQIININEPEK